MKYFLYCRKSTDEDGKQILSLESQRVEMARRGEHWPDVEIIETIEEARSAKTPGRPLFDAMLKRIEKGEAHGIVAWDPDRLARNSVDGGKVIHMLDTGKVRDLKFATYTFENTPQGKFMLSIMFGNSKYMVDTLSVNVRRGMTTKAEHGWFPSIAPLGYLNDKTTTFIVPDPERFDLVRRMWRLALTGGYTVSHIHEVINEEWGLRTVKRKKMGGGKLSLSGVYRILSNPFYAGVFVWQGRTWPGHHQAMITLGEFERVQVLLGRPRQARPHKREFPLTGLIICGECGYGITAEEKTNRFGSRYTYYRCTKRKPGYRCSQKYVSAESLEAQVEAFLARLRIPTPHVKWADAMIQKERGAKASDVTAARAAIDRALAANARERSNLTTLRVRDLLNDDEFNERREALDRDKLRLDGERHELDVSRDWFEPYEKLKLFSNRATEWYRAGDTRTKRLILKVACSNPTLKDRKLFVEATEPVREWAWPAVISELCSTLNDVRTLTATNNAEFRQTIASIEEIIAWVEKRYEESKETEAAA